MTNESSDKHRPYRKRLRAEQEAETRLRITEAAVDLHGSVGPARTTVKAVAEKAGVQRATVYRHFPTENDLFAACSSHWAGLNPPPNPEPWQRIADPDERLTRALSEMYAWFEAGEGMLSRTGRDAHLVPAMEQIQVATRAITAWMAEILVKGRRERGRRRALVSAAICHALSFPTWQSLVSEQGMTSAEAAEVMHGMVDAAGAEASR